MHDVDGGRLAHIVDVSLIGYAEDVDAGAHQGLGMAVQSALYSVHDEVWHLAVDVPGQFDESRFDAGLLRLPRQVERVDGDTVAAEARTRIKRHEAEGLRGCGVDDFPDVDAHAVAHHGHFISQTDVNHTEGVFEELDHLGDRRVAYRHDVFERLGV